MLGVHPGPFTLRELLWMSEHRSKEAWSHTSALLALLANAHRDPKRSTSFSPADFNPHQTSRSSKIVGTTSDLSILKTVFVDPHAKQ